MSKKNGINPNPGQVTETFSIPGRTNFYMPSFRTFDIPPGLIVPIKRYRMVPTDRLETTLSAVVNTFPAKAPVMGRYRCRVYAFWVPDRLYTPELRLNYTNNLSDSSSFVDAFYPTFPVYRDLTFRLFNGEDDVSSDDQTPYVSKLSLLNCIGLPNYGHGHGISNGIQSTSGRAFNALDILAYYDIFRNYFANVNEEHYYCMSPILTTNSFDAETPVAESSNWTTSFLPFRLDFLNNYYRSQAWLNNVTEGFGMSDSIPGLQRTIGAIRPGLDTELGYVYRDANIETPFNSQYWKVKPTVSVQNVIIEVDGDFMDHSIEELDGGYDLGGASMGYVYPFLQLGMMPMSGLVAKTYMKDMFSAGINDTQYRNIINQSMVALQDGGLNLNDLLVGQKLYEYFSKLAATGSRYDEFIRAEFGVDIRKYLDIPTFIKSWSWDLGFSHVTATTSGADGQELGSLGGRGTGRLNDDQFNFSADEYGSLQFYMTIEPYVSYSAGVDPFLTDLQYSDMYSTSFDRMGLEQQNVLYMNGRQLLRPDEALFYQPSWLKYKTDTSRTFGEMAEDFNYWTLVRPVSGSLFQTDEYRHYDPYSSYIAPAAYLASFTSASNKYPCPFFVQVGFDTTMKRPLSSNSLDTFSN